MENKATIGGFRDSRGEWRPENPVSYAPIFTWPSLVKKFFFWLYATNKLPYLDFQKQPVHFVLLFLLIPFRREFHFYLIHWLIHWKPLCDRVQYLHHYNINPGPWSGLSCHPVSELRLEALHQWPVKKVT